jgi:P-type E1-E2 ATPase
MGYETCIISGDNEEVVKKVSLELGIKEYYYSKKPDEKKDLVALMSEKSNILMVGDGINDAPALKKAAVSISYSSGFDLASKNSDIVSLGSGVRMVREAIELSTITSKTIKQNIYWAIVYNIAMVPMAVMGMITPLFAAIAMPISSIVVISNAGLIKFKSRK